MNKRFHRGISLLLAAIMALSLIVCAPALAETEDETFPEDSVLILQDEELSLGEEFEGEPTIVESEGCVEGEAAEAGPATASGFAEGEEDEILGDNQEDVEPEDNMSAPQGIDDSLGAGDEDVSASATPKLTLSASSVSVKKGNTTSVTVKASGFSGSIYLSYSTNNSTSYKCTWGSWYSLSIPLRIQGNSVGSGTVTIYMKSSSNNKVLTSVKLSVKVVSPDNPKVSASFSSVSLEVGKSQAINVTGSGYSGSFYFQYANSNTSVASCSWRSYWSGNTIPITITAKAAGSAKITIYMRASNSGTLLATTTISVSAYKKQTPKVTLSTSGATIDAGKSVVVRATVSGVSGSYYLSYGTTNSSAYRCTWASKWSGSSIDMTVTGQNAGSGTVTVYLKNASNNQTLSQASVSITVRAVVKPTVTISPSSVSMSAGGSVSVNVAVRNLNESAYLQFGIGNANAFSAAWNGTSGGANVLKITGKAKGTGYVNVYLKRNSNNSVIAQASVYVSVTGLTMQDVAYGFHNYSTSISEAICKMMYANSPQKALSVYNSRMGNGGVCFGMATSSGLIDYKSNSPYVSTFSSSKSRISDLSKSDRSSSLSLTVDQFIQAMHISQASPKLKTVYNNLNSLVSTVKSEIDAGRFVKIGIRGYYNGSEGGHAVLAYGYDQFSSTQFNIKIYDSNYVNSPTSMSNTILRVTRSSSTGSYNSWSYPFTSSVTWGTGRSGASINYVTYANYQSMWNNRGHLAENGLNLFSSNEGSFTVLDFDGKVVARYKDGVMVEKGDGVVEIVNEGMQLDGEAGNGANMFYAPVDFYTIIDDTADTPMDLSIADDMLSIKVETEADQFDLCADDSNDLVNAILDAEAGMPFAVTLGSSRDEDPDEIRIEGYGTGETISIGLLEGELSISGADSASLSITNYDDSFVIEALSGEGGSITPSGATEVKIGGSQVYTIAPSAGYALKAVYVDGESIGAVNEYIFSDVTQSHTIYAEFTRDIDVCGVTLSQSTYNYDGTAHCPKVTVRTPEGELLSEGVDYELSYENNVNVGTATLYVLAMTNGGYNGMKAAAFDIVQNGDAIQSATYNTTSKRVTVKLTHTATVYVAAAAYDADGRMIAARTSKASAGTNSLELSFDGADMSGKAVIKVMLLDTSLKPLCAYVTAQ